MSNLDILREVQTLFERMAKLIIEHGHSDLQYPVREMKCAIDFIDIALDEARSQDNDYENELVEIREIMENLYRQTRGGLSEFHIWPDKNGVNEDISQINNRLMEIYWGLYKDM